ncbi:hypothetical protein SOVF_145320, partial [Spinacia oleracea]
MLTFLHLNSLKAIKINTHTRRNSIRLGRRSVRCDSTVEMSTEKHQIKVSNGDDSVEICRVLNGMWQTSGRWGRIDRDNVVESMLRYSDAGLSTFDMADHSTEAEKSSVVVMNGKDCLEMCGVVNGMWQTSGGWGKIDRDNAVDAMLRYADVGLATFDMADI